MTVAAEGADAGVVAAGAMGEKGSISREEKATRHALNLCIMLLMKARSSVTLTWWSSSPGTTEQRLMM